MDTFYPPSCRRRKRSLTVSNFIPAFAASRTDRLKGIRKIPPRGGILANAIAHHPTPATLPAGGKAIEAPSPLRGGGGFPPSPRFT